MTTYSFMANLDRLNKGQLIKLVWALCVYNHHEGQPDSYWRVAKVWPVSSRSPETRDAMMSTLKTILANQEIQVLG